MKKVYLENFGPFKDKTTVEIAPLTVLIGKNSSGKSSFIKALFLLQDYLFGGKEFTRLNLFGPNSKYHKIMSIDQVINHSSQNETVSLGFEQWGLECLMTFKKDINNFELPEVHRDRYAMILGYFELTILSSLKLSIDRLETIDGNLIYSTKIPEIFKFQLIKNTLNKIYPDLDFENLENLKNQISELPEIEVLRQYISQLESITENFTDVSALKTSLGIQLPKEFRPITFFDFLKMSQHNEYPPVVKIILNSWGAQWYSSLESYLSNYIYYLSPVKSLKKDLYPLRSFEEGFDLTIYNFNTYYHLSTNDVNNLPGGIGLLSKWLKLFGIGDQLKLEQVENNYVAIKILKGDKWIGFSEIGFGATQIVFLLMGFMGLGLSYFPIDDVPKIIICEEPEANLHPNYQSLLADLFIELIKTYRLNIIVETHSEYLVRRLQLLVAKGASENISEINIKSEDILINYFSNSNENASIKKISINHDGSLSDNFDKGFYDVASQNIVELLKIKKNLN